MNGPQLEQMIRTGNYPQEVLDILNAQANPLGQALVRNEVLFAAMDLCHRDPPFRHEGVPIHSPLTLVELARSAINAAIESLPPDSRV